MRPDRTNHLPRRLSSVGPGWCDQHGQSLVEYTVLMALIGLVMVIGQDSPLEELMRAIQAYYGRFTFALAMP